MGTSKPNPICTGCINFATIWNLASQQIALRVKGKSDLLGLVRRVWGVPRTETLPMRLPGPGERAVRLPFPLADRVPAWESKALAAWPVLWDFVNLTQIP